MGAQGALHVLVDKHEFENFAYLGDPIYLTLGVQLISSTVTRLKRCIGVSNRSQKREMLRSPQ